MSNPGEREEQPGVAGSDTAEDAGLSGDVGDGAPHGEVQAQPDATRGGLVALVVMAITLLLFAMLAVVDTLTRRSVRHEVQVKLLEPESTALRELRAQEELKLSRYQWIDREKGIVRIPIERAAELTLRDWASRSAGFSKGSGAAVGN